VRAVIKYDGPESPTVEQGLESFDESGDVVLAISGQDRQRGDDLTDQRRVDQ
jgi:hypothetical protein